MRKGILATICTFSIAILVVIIGFFLLDIEKIALHIWAFAALEFSLLISLLAMVTLVAPRKNQDAVLYVAGMSGAVWIYEIAVIISVLFTASFAEHLSRFIFLQIVINAVFVIAAIVIIRVTGHVYDSNREVAENIKAGKYDEPKRGGF